MMIAFSLHHHHLWSSLFHDVSREIHECRRGRGWWRLNYPTMVSRTESDGSFPNIIMMGESISETLDDGEERGEEEHGSHRFYGSGSLIDDEGENGVKITACYRAFN